MTIGLGDELYALGNALAVVDELAVVDAAHCLDKDLKLSAFLGCRDAYCLFLVATIQLADVFAIDKDGCEVMKLVDMEHRWHVGLRQ